MIDWLQVAEQDLNKAKPGPIKGAIRALIFAMKDSSKDSQRTTAQATQTAPTEDNCSDAAWLTVAEEMLEKLGTAGTSVENLSSVYGLLRLLVYRPGSTTPMTQASSQSAQVDTQNGPVQLNSGFAHCGRPLIAEMGWKYEEPHLLTVTCQICNASWRLGRIPVPRVTPILSTSANPLLRH